MEILLLSFVKKIIQLYIVGDIYVSDDIAEESFICDIEKCKGACCVEGELGAPLNDQELGILTKEAENIKPYLSEEGKVELDKQGLFVLDPDGEYSTPTIEGKECAYAIYENDGTLACGIEKAWKDGKTDFRKPISCHLYPIREVQYPKFLALNYHKWGICSPACELGKKMGTPIYIFLKEALIRRFGEAWYEDLKNQIKMKN